MKTKIRIVLADDHPIVRSGLRNLIQSQSDLEVVGEASSGLEALKLIRESQPELAIIDLTMPGLNGIQLGRRLAEEMPPVRVLMLTLHEDRAFLKQALDAGIRGYILKRSAAESLLQAIRAVMNGGLYIDPGIANSLFDGAVKSGARQKGASILPELTQRESEVLKLVASGFTNKEIAYRLDLGIKSIETYRMRGLEKLGMKSRVELVRYASTAGWLAIG